MDSHKTGTALFYYLTETESYYLSLSTEKFELETSVNFPREYIIDTLGITEFPVLVALNQDFEQEIIINTLPLILLSVDEPGVVYEDSVL